MYRLSFTGYPVIAASYDDFEGAGGENVKRSFPYFLGSLPGKVREADLKMSSNDMPFGNMSRPGSHAKAVSNEETMEARFVSSLLASLVHNFLYDIYDIMICHFIVKLYVCPSRDV